MGIKHGFTSQKQDNNNPTQIQPSHWNADHNFDFGHGNNVFPAGVLIGQGNDQLSVLGSGNIGEFLQRKVKGGSAHHGYSKLPYIVSSHYNFDAISPNVNLTAGVPIVIALTPVPIGVNATNIDHYLLIEDGVAGDEIVKIATPGDATSGSNSGTVTITPTLNHSAANWTIKSATAGIQEAINSLGSQGGVVKIPEGVTTIYGPITIKKNYVKLHGTGFYSTWLQTSYKANNLLVVDGTSFAGNVGQCELENFTIVGPNDGAATNYGVSIKGQVFFRCRNVNISQVANGFLVDDDNNTDSWGFENCWVSVFVSNGWRIAGSNGGYAQCCGAVSGGANSSGFRVEKTGGFTARQCFSFACAYGLHICPASGQSASLMWIDSSVFDFCTKDAIRIAPLHATAVVHSVNFVNSYSSFSSDNGCYISTEGGGEIEEITFIGHRALLNNKAGIVVRGTKIKNITITGSTITSNSVQTPGASDEIYIEPAADGPDGITITNNIVGPSSYHGHNVRVGINFGYSATPGATDNVICTGNKISEKVTTASGNKLYIAGLDVCSGKNIIAKDNTPDSNILISAVQIGAQLLLGGSTKNMFTVTGTTAIGDMVPAWKGRQVIITKTDAGTLNFNTGATFRNAKTLAQNESLIAIYDGTLWSLIKG